MAIRSYTDLISLFTSDTSKKYILLTQEKFVDLVDTLYYGTLGATGSTGATGSGDTLSVSPLLPDPIDYIDNDKAITREGDVYSHVAGSWDYSFNLFEFDLSDTGSSWISYVTGATPGLGGFSLDQTSLSAVTSISISTTSNWNHDFSAFLAQIQIGQLITIRQRGSIDILYIGSITSISESGGVYTFACDLLVGVGDNPGGLLQITFN